MMDNQALDLNTAIDRLKSHREEWDTLISYLEIEREKFLADLRQAATSDDVMKLAGSIATITEMIELLA